MSEANVTYVVKDWGRHYEKAQTRACRRADWVPIPNKHDGKSLGRLLRLEDGVAIYGAWILLLQVASKCPTRGTLADDDGPLTLVDLEIKTGCPASAFERAVSVLASKDIGWLLIVRHQHAKESLQLQDRTRQDITKQDSAAKAACGEPPAADSAPACDGAPAILVFPTKGKPKRDWSLRQAKLGEYVECYPDFDVLAELRKALQWIRDNPTKRKSYSGMPAFLTRWLNGCQNRGGGRSRAGPGDQTRQALDASLFTPSDER